MFAPFSPLSPMSPISPVLVPYPFVYPMVSPLQSFALPVIPGPLPMTPPPTMQPTPTPKVPPSAKNNLTVVTSVAQPIATSQSYSPHRVVDGATLLPTGSHRVDNVTAARAVVRPLSTPPTPVHGPDASIAKVRNRRLEPTSCPVLIHACSYSPRRCREAARRSEVDGHPFRIRIQAISYTFWKTVSSFSGILDSVVVTLLIPRNALARAALW